MCFIKYRKNNLPKTYTHQGLFNKSIISLKFYIFILIVFSLMKIVKDPMTATLQIYTFQNPLSESLPIIKDFLIVSRTSGDLWFGRS
jgi:hypothetical protein